MKNMMQCRRVKKAISKKTPLTAEFKQHLLTCPACRRFARAEQILDLLREFRQQPAAVPEDFVDRVMSGLTVKEQPKSWLPPSALRWAAALLIFSMAVGYGFSSKDTIKGMDQVVSLTAGFIPLIEGELLGFSAYFLSRDSKQSESPILADKEIGTDYYFFGK